jgi:anti-sigma B factor antagonist
MGVQQFEATAEVVDGVLVVAVRGELDISTSPQVRELLADVPTDQAYPVVVDLARCDFIDSTGLATLLHGAKHTQDGASRVAIVSPRGEVRRVLELTAVDKLIRVFASLEEAVTAIRTMDA